MILPENMEEEMEITIDTIKKQLTGTQFEKLLKYIDLIAEDRSVRKYWKSSRMPKMVNKIPAKKDYSIKSKG